MANNFARRGTTLYRDQEESVAVVTLQGSVYGGRYYLNVGVWLKALGGSDAPKVHQCQVQARLAGMRPAPDDDEHGEAFLLGTATCRTRSVAHSSVMSSTPSSPRRCNEQGCSPT